MVLQVKWNIGVLEYWGTCVMSDLITEVVEYWSAAQLGYLSTLVLEDWTYELLE